MSQPTQARVYFSRFEDPEYNPIIYFQWLGEPTEACREQAAQYLQSFLKILINDILLPEVDIHVFAHSHGGNVVGQALSYLDISSLDLSKRGGVVFKSVTLLGTPAQVKGRNWSDAIQKVGHIYNYYSLHDSIQGTAASYGNSVDWTSDHGGFYRAADLVGCFRPLNNAKVTNYDFSVVTSENGRTAHSDLHELIMAPLFAVPEGLSSTYNTENVLSVPDESVKLRLEDDVKFRGMSGPVVLSNAAKLGKTHCGAPVADGVVLLQVATDVEPVADGVEPVATGVVPVATGVSCGGDATEDGNYVGCDPMEDIPEDSEDCFEEGINGEEPQPDLESYLDADQGVENHVVGSDDASPSDATGSAATTSVFKGMSRKVNRKLRKKDHHSKKGHSK